MQSNSSNDTQIAFTIFLKLAILGFLLLISYPLYAVYFIPANLATSALFNPFFL